MRADVLLGGCVVGMAMLAGVTIDWYAGARRVPSSARDRAPDPTPTLVLRADPDGESGHVRARCSRRDADGCAEWTIVGWVPFDDGDVGDDPACTMPMPTLQVARSASPHP